MKFLEYDNNNDGLISKEEFTEYMKRINIDIDETQVKLWVHLEIINLLVLLERRKFRWIHRL